MTEYDDPLDLLDDDGDPVIETCFLEEDERQSKKSTKPTKGCSSSLIVIFIMIIFVGYLASLIL